MITLTHFRGPKMLVSKAHVAAIVPSEIIAASGETVDSQTNTIVVLSTGHAYHVRETVEEVQQALSAPGQTVNVEIVGADLIRTIAKEAAAIIRRDGINRRVG